MSVKNFMSIDEQIDRLKTLGIRIDSTKKTKQILYENSYYNIINGYRRPFLFNQQPDRYLKETGFIDIYALYHFDRQLRRLLFQFLLEIENKLKTQIMYAFLNERDSEGNCIRRSDGYLHLMNYDIHEDVGRKKSNQAINLIANLQKSIAKSFKESDAISHYLTKYGYVPLWVLSTRMTFGDICSFYECMTPQNRQSVAKHYHMQDGHLITNMKLLAFARNHCAHGNRIYCLRKRIDLPIPDLSQYPIQHRLVILNRGKHNFLNVYVSLKYFLSLDRYKELIDKTTGLIDILRKRLQPKVMDEVLNIMGLNINMNELK